MSILVAGSVGTSRDIFHVKVPGAKLSRDGETSKMQNPEYFKFFAGVGLVYLTKYRACFGLTRYTGHAPFCFWASMPDIVGDEKAKVYLAEF
jgi:hypothetical protein